MRIRVLTFKKENEFVCWIFSQVVLEFHFILRKTILSPSISSVLHTISTSFPLRGVYDLIRPYKFSIVSLNEVSLVIFCSIFLME